NHLVPSVIRGHDPASDVKNALGISNGRAAVFLDDKTHEESCGEKGAEIRGVMGRCQRRPEVCENDRECPPRPCTRCQRRILGAPPRVVPLWSVLHSEYTLRTPDHPSQLMTRPGRTPRTTMQLTIL